MGCTPVWKDAIPERGRGARFKTSLALRVGIIVRAISVERETYMAAKSSIEWTDATWNPVRGCIKISPGCTHCYAETFAERFRGVAGHPYEQGFDLRLVPENLGKPLHWKKPRRVFVNSMSDLFQDGVPDEFIHRVFAVMASASRHTFQV